MKYSALIRTYNSAGSLPHTLASLARQSAPPDEYVFVDSGSADETLTLVPPGSIVLGFEGREFNYSEALNQGLGHVTGECVLIVSSHTTLSHPGAIKFALNILASNDAVGAAYFTHAADGELRVEEIDRASFDGFNGIWNTCSLVRMRHLRARAFRPEVFIAEDQEWSSWLLSSEGRTIARIDGAGMDHRRNANVGEYMWSRKRLNEYVSVAYFANRRLLGWRSLGRIALDALSPLSPFPPRGRVFCLRLLGHLLRCLVIPPRYSSRYF